jgi:hypothetical protein
VALGAGDCERLGAGLVAQPVNTASALAYLAVGAWLAGRGRRAGGRPGTEGSGEPQGGAPVGREGSGEPQGGAPENREGSGEPQGGAPVSRVAFGVVVAAAGVGSVDFHGPGSPAARLLHDAGLYAVVGFVVVHELARRAGRLRRARAGVPWVGWTPRRRRAYRAALAVTGVGAACWWLGRTGSPLCDPDSPLQGHAAWHLLSAAALALWAEAALDPGQARS